MGHPLIRHFNYRQETLAAAHGWRASKPSKLQPHTCTNQVLTTTKNDLWGVQAMKRPFSLQLPPMVYQSSIQQGLMRGNTFEYYLNQPSGQKPPYNHTVAKTIAFLFLLS